MCSGVSGITLWKLDTESDEMRRRQPWRYAWSLENNKKLLMETFMRCRYNKKRMVTENNQEDAKRYERRV